MKLLKRLIAAALLLPLCNVVFIGGLANASTWTVWLILVIGGLFYVVYSIIPGRISGTMRRKTELKLQILCGGCELIMVAALCVVAEVIIYGVLWNRLTWGIAVSNGAIYLILLFLMILQGVIRIMLTSRQVKIGSKILLLFIWWIPVVNFILIARICRTARREFEVESRLKAMDLARKENEVCRTCYPVLMVHGIFFRDWHYFNYWGRIPQALTRNGARVYYGKQQSALPIEESARELREQILEIIKSEGCGKVNIIAHSKGGLDARYAISCLGMAPYVASLTTINTPHLGCRWVDDILKKLPDGLIQWVGKRYNKLFRKLGDKEPDFLNAVQDLTAARAAVFNQQVRNCPGILYQSTMSKMDSPRSAGFPLNMGYRIIRSSGCVSDGLVPIEAAAWGNYLGLLSVPGRRGISHGDMIDLFRENIRGFDVREFYVDLIKGLKDRGL